MQGSTSRRMKSFTVCHRKLYSVPVCNDLLGSKRKEHASVIDLADAAD